MTNELINKLLKQADDSFIVSVYQDKILPMLLDKIPKYYVGGSYGVLKNAVRQYGGHFNCRFRLGYAGFSSSVGGFYISYDYFDSYYKVIKPRYIEEYGDSLLLTDKDIDDIVLGLSDFVSRYLIEKG